MTDLAELSFVEASGRLLQELNREALRLWTKWKETLLKAQDILRQGGKVTFEKMTSETWLDVVMMMGQLESEGYTLTTKTRMYGDAGPILLDCELTAAKKEAEVLATTAKAEREGI